MATRPGTIEHWLGVIRREHPDLDLALASIEVLQAGIDHTLLEVDRRFIFRLRKDGSRRAFAREVKILQALQGQLRTATPTPAFVGRELPYMGYPTIAGVPLSTVDLDAMSQRARHVLATELGEFLCQFYGALPVAVAADLAIERFALPDLKPMVETLRSEFNKVPWVPIFAEYACLEWSRSDAGFAVESVVHWDLQGGNILIDPDTGSLRGIIDFDSVRICDVHAEFRSIYRIDRSLGGNVMNEFSRHSGLTLSYRRAMIYGWLLKLLDLAKYARLTRSPTHKRALACLHRWYAADGPATRAAQ